MNPHDLLTSDHQRLRDQAGKLKEFIGQNPQTLTEALTEFQKNVQKHFKREDVYYRVLDDGKRIEDRGLIHQLRNDHAAVVFTLESLAIRLRKNGVNADWRIRFDNLMNVLIPHLDKEDGFLFPLGQKMLSPQELASLADQIQNLE